MIVVEDLTRRRHRSLTTLAGYAGAVIMTLLPASACSSSDDSPATVNGDGGVDNDANALLGDAAADGAAADPSRNADTQDLDPANGDPSLDISGSWIRFDSAEPWVRAEFFGSWPPPATLYSWSCSVLLGTKNAPLVTYTVRSLSGTQTDYAEGLDKAKITFKTEPNGFRVLFADSTLAFDRYGLECDVKKASSSPLVQDASGSFEVTNKEQGAFNP